MFPAKSVWRAITEFTPSVGLKPGLQVVPPLTEYSILPPGSKPSSVSEPTFVILSLESTPESVASATLGAVGKVVSSV